MEKKKFDVEFHGTNLFALVPLLLFVVFCILFFVVFKTFDMMHLCMGGYVALIIGSLLSKNWGKYWDAVATGMSSKIMNELALILLIVGILGIYTAFVRKIATGQCFNILDDSRERMGQMIVNEMQNEQDHLEAASYLMKNLLTDYDANEAGRRIYVCGDDTV